MIAMLTSRLIGPPIDDDCYAVRLIDEQIDRQEYESFLLPFDP